MYGMVAQHGRKSECLFYFPREMQQHARYAVKKKRDSNENKNVGEKSWKKKLCVRVSANHVLDVMHTDHLLHRANFQTK
jgi:hypothetical protein